MKKTNNFVCKDHLDTCIDDFVNLFETFPILNNVSNFENAKCLYCNLKADYNISCKQQNK